MISHLSGLIAPRSTIHWETAPQMSLLMRSSSRGNSGKSSPDTTCFPQEWTKEPKQSHIEPQCHPELQGGMSGQDRDELLTTILWYEFLLSEQRVPSVCHIFPECSCSLQFHTNTFLKCSHHVLSLFGNLCQPCNRSGQPHEMFILFQAEECNTLHTTDYPALILFVHAKPTWSSALSIYEGFGDCCCFGAHKNGFLAHMKEHHSTGSRRLMSSVRRLITFVSKFQLKQT